MAPAEIALDTHPGCELAYQVIHEAYGNAGRNILRGDGYQNADLSLYKEFLFSEQRKFQLRFEAFNAFNLHSFTIPNATVNDPNFGRITSARGYRPAASRSGPDRRAKSMMVALEYDNRAVGALYYSREVPSLFRGLRLSKLFGRRGVITFESNGSFIIARGQGLPRFIVPGFRDIRGYQAMFRDFVAAIRTGRPPEMSLERAMDDQRLMDQIYATVHDDEAGARGGPGAA